MRKLRAALQPSLLALLLTAIAYAGAAAQTTAPPTGDALKDDAVRLVQPTDSARRAALLALLRERGVTFELQPFETRTGADSTLRRGQNVVATFGSGPREIILGAHYDAVKGPSGALVGGMVDNGAASAVLVHIAQALRGRPLRHTVRVIWFDLEELGLLGSRAYVARADRSRIAGMVNVDVFAYGDGFVFGPAAVPNNGAIYRAMWRTCAEGGYRCMEFPAFPPSDDRSFQAAGIANISIAMTPTADAHQLWLMLNAGASSGLRDGFVPGPLRVIHTVEDSPARLEPVALSTGYGALLALVMRLDTELVRP
jgi:hypothetical protein